jgi:hypothetical protein
MQADGAAACASLPSNALMTDSITHSIDAQVQKFDLGLDKKVALQYIPFHTKRAGGKKKVKACVLRMLRGLSRLAPCSCGVWDFTLGSVDQAAKTELGLDSTYWQGSTSVA